MIDFFIRRPVFTSVCSVIIIIAGLICIPLLPVSQYPELAPPMVTVTSMYTGASSEVVETAVTTPLEQAINGVESMKYMTSTSSNDGVSSIQITFELERNKDIAAVDVENRISSVIGTLPQEVQKTGVSISKQSTALVAVYAFYSENDEYDDIYISNYVDKYVSDDILRINGVGGITIAGERKYAMRVWLYPDKLAARDLTASDVVNAITEQNVQVPAGQIGEPPIRDDQNYQLNIKVHGRLSTPSEFEDIVLKTGSDGSLVTIKDVGYVELGSESYDTFARFNSKSTVGLLIYQLADANSLSLYKSIVEKMTELEKDFPPGLKVKTAVETISIVEDSINEVVFTLFLAVVLVVSVIFFFLQSWRSTLIPVITIPVSLIGTFAILKVFGFSINTLTLFGIVLATGLVVDDAIVVIENIERTMEEKGLSAIAAASESMSEVIGALVASTLVLAAVFLPVAAFPGTTGQLYKQFALTIVFAFGISLFNALTLTPALSGLLLKTKTSSSKHIIFDKVESFIKFLTRSYYSILERILKFKLAVVFVFLILIGLTYYLVTIVPTGFVPNEDQGYFITTVQGPEGTSLNYTQRVIEKAEDELKKIPEVEDIFAVGGFSFSGNGPNKAVLFTTLRPFEERKGKQHSDVAVIQRFRQAIAPISEAIIMPFQPPAIKGIGNVGGFQFQLLDIGGHPLEELSLTAQKLIQQGNQSSVLQGLFTTFSADCPQLYITIDRKKAKRMGIDLSGLFGTIQVFLGSKYVNDFDFLDRVYRVYVQAEKIFRDDPEDIREFYVRSSTTGNLIPLDAVVNIDRKYTAQTITHFDLYRSVEVDGSSAPGYSSGQAIIEMEKLAKENLPEGFSFQWSGISLEEKKAGQAGIFMFALGLLFVYLFLAAQYESLIDPLIIILAVPLAVFGALLAQYVRGLENDVFCQIGLVMLIGLACKNSILIVEFANQQIDMGKKPVQAVLEAAKTRFRPILMTSLAFILGIFPLVIATGAGAASRNSMGTAVFGGMFLSTLLSLFVVPVLFLLAKGFENRMRNLFKREKRKQV